MSDKKYPGYQNMISLQEPATILSSHQGILAYRGATDDDCRIGNLEVITERNDPLAYQQGFRSRFQLHWTTSKGWVCYMQHTGCYSIDCNESPQPEPTSPEPTTNKE